MRYVVVDIETNIVVNVIVWDGVTPWIPPEGTFAVRSDTLNIGDTYTP